MAGLPLRRAVLVAWLAVGAACSAPTPDELLSDASAAIAKGDARTAEIQLKNLLQEQPDNTTGRLLLGKLMVQTGDPSSAEQNLRRALALGADAAAVQVPLLRSLLEQGKFADALAQVGSGPELEGADRVEALGLEGAAQRGLGQREPAEAAYRAALRIDPKSLPVRSDLASLLLESRRTDEAGALIDEILRDDPNFVSALLLRGALEATTAPATAEATFQRVVDLERASSARTTAYAVALSQVAEIQLNQGKIDAAAGNADALLALAPKNPAARYLKAAVEVRQNDLDAAERRLESLVAESPKYWPAHRLLGAINVIQNQPEQAISYLRTAVTNNPDDAAARLQLAELYVRTGNVDGAKALMAASPGGAPVSDGLFFAFAGGASQRAGLTEQAAQYFDQSEQALPDDVRSLVGLSSIYTSAGEFDRAVRVLQSKSFDDAQSERLRNYLLALVQVRQGDLKAADATAQRVGEADPAAAWPLNLRGSIAMIGGDLPGAKGLLEKALALEPQSTGTLLNLARVAAAQNDAPRAEQYLRRVVDIDAKNVAAPVGLAQLAVARRDFTSATSWVERLEPSPLRSRLEGDLLAAQGNYADAAAIFARAYDAAPSAELALRAYDAGSRSGRADADAKLLAWSAGHPQDPSSNLALGTLALEKNDLAAAVQRYEAVLAANPTHATSLNNLAWIYSQRGDARALDFAKRAHAAEPNNPAIADTLGWLQVQSGAAAEGLPLLAQAAAALPDQAEIRYHWGAALAETGDAAKAREVLQAALAGSEQFSWRADAERRLAALQGGAAR